MALRRAVAGMGLPEPPTDFAGSSSYENCTNPAKNHGSLQNYLDVDLQNVDGRRVFTVNGLRKLGFNSREFIEQHFSKYGKVTEVFVLKVSSKPTIPDTPQRKIRAGNFGIVVMESTESVCRILGADANEHVVQRVPIRVNEFVRPSENMEEKPKAELIYFAQDDKFEKQISNQFQSTAVSSYGGGFEKQISSQRTCSNFSDEFSGEDFYKAVARLKNSGDPFRPVIDDYWAPRKVPLQNLSAEALGIQCDLSQTMLSQADHLCAQAHRLRSEAECIRLNCNAVSLLHQTEQREANRLASEAVLRDAQAAGGYPPSCPPLPPANWLAKPLQPNYHMPGPVVPEPMLPESKCNGTLSAHLIEAREADPSCVFVVRQIHKIGFHSCELLRRHYSHYGKVLRVLVADKRVKSFPGCVGERKTRPGGMGLIIMHSTASVNIILAAGCEQLVGGHTITVQPYEGDMTLNVVTQMSV